jgi:amino acid transporter
MPPRQVWERALPVDRHLDFADPQQSRSGRFVHIRSAPREADDDELEATVEAGETDSRSGRVGHALRKTLIGPALRSTAIAEERMGRLLALAVLSPDALSSVAYGPEAMMAILVLAGSAELKLSLPIGAALAVLMLSVGLGYRQVIRAYPHGGGSYIVASDSLGRKWGLLAGAGLILDYILTVAVSVASGVEAVTSAIPSLGSARVVIGLVVIVLLVAGNLRGVRDAGAAFAAPTYLFVVAIALVVIAGLIKAGSHGFHPTAAPPHRATEALGVLLVLRAFASGATAMTGIEVISNAVPVFRPPQARHARQTLTVMLGLLITMFIGVVLVAHFDGAAPSGSETVLSQIAHDSVGGGIPYGFVQVATTLVLLVAANSAFNGFPRLLYFMARDGYVPRLFLRMGDRLAFSNGILVLAVPAAVIYAAFGGRTAPLIPLFAIGVFLAFTLAQSGMVAYWLRHREPKWRSALATNLLGAVLSALVVLIATATKLTEGAWVVVVLVPLIVFACGRIHAHYVSAREALTPRPDAPRPELDGRTTRVAPPRLRSEVSAHLAETQDDPSEVHSFAVVPVAVLDLAALHALAYAVSLAQPVLALHLSPTEEEAKRFHRAWHAWGDHLPLEVVVSPYRSTVAPLANYIAALHRQRPDVILTLVVPEIVVAKSWQRILHNRTAARLRSSLLAYEGIVITTVPFHLPK